MSEVADAFFVFYFGGFRERRLNILGVRAQRRGVIVGAQVLLQFPVKYNNVKHAKSIFVT